MARGVDSGRTSPVFMTRGRPAAAPSPEEPELASGDERASRSHCRGGDIDRVAGLVDRDRVVAGGVGVLALGAATPDAVKRREARYTGNLSLDGINHGDVPTSSGGPKPLLSQYRARGLRAVSAPATTTSPARPG